MSATATGCNVAEALRVAQGPTSPAVLAETTGIALADLMVLANDHPLIVVDRRGFLRHTFSLLIDVISKEAAVGVVDLAVFGTTHLPRAADRPGFVKHLHAVAACHKLHVFTRAGGKRHVHVKRCTQYNVYDADSMASTIERRGIEGVNIEAMYKEYSTAYTDLTALVNAGTVFVNEMQAYAMSAVLPLDAV
jgi:hypothetical protein